MIQRLTTGNKKQMKCSCGNTFSWNTIEQNIIVGNHVIECPECGTKYIVPSSELLPYFNNNTINYTSNIYSDSSGGGGSESNPEVGSLFVVFLQQGEEEIIASRSFKNILYQIEYDQENGTYQKNNIQGLYYIQLNNYGKLMLLNLEEITMDVNYNPLALHFIGYAVQPVNKQARKVEIIYSSTGELSIEQTPCSIEELSS